MGCVRMVVCEDCAEVVGLVFEWILHNGGVGGDAARCVPAYRTQHSVQVRDVLQNESGFRLDIVLVVHGLDVIPLRIILYLREVRHAPQFLVAVL